MGVVFKLTPLGSTYLESVLYTFLGGSDGALPSGSLLADKAGGLYGVTLRGGAFGLGTVFRLVPYGSTYRESVLYSFRSGFDGQLPSGSLVADKNGSLYGTTAFGGRFRNGTGSDLYP